MTSQTNKQTNKLTNNQPNDKPPTDQQIAWQVTCDAHSAQFYSRISIARPAKRESWVQVKLARGCLGTPSSQLHCVLGGHYFFLAVRNSSIGLIVRPSVCLLPLTIRVFTTLQSEPRDLWPLTHLIRVMNRHDLTEKIPTYLHTYPPTYLPTHLLPLQNTLKEQS